MKDRIKRTLALMLACILFFATVFTDGFSVRAEGETGRITFSIQGIDGTSLNTSANVKLTSGDTVYHDGVWDAAKDFNAGTYHYLINCAGYLPSEGDVTVTDGGNAQVAVTLGKEVTCTFTVSAYGSPLSGVQVVCGEQQYQTDAEGKVSVNMKAGENYSIKLTSAGYETKSMDVTAATDNFTLADVDMGYKSVNKTLTVTYGDTLLKGAVVTFQEQDGTEQLTAAENNGSYSAVLKVGKTYNITAVCDGFTVNGAAYTVDENTNCPSLSAEPASLEIAADQNQVTYNGANTQNVVFSIVSGKIDQPGFSYEWKSSDTSVLTVEDGRVTACKQGNAAITLECKYNNTVVQTSNSVGITVNPGSVQGFSVAENNTETTDQNTIQFNVSGIVEAGTLTMTASGGNLNGNVTKEWEVEAGTSSVSWKVEKSSLSNNDTYLQGAVTYSFTYKCTSANYNDATASPFGETYFITKELGCEVKSESADGTLEEVNDIVYGDDRTLKIVPDEGTTENSSSLTYTVSEGSDVISVDADGKITVLNAGNAKIKVIRDKDSQNYWDEASCEISLSVDKKELDPLDPAITVFEQNDDDRIYDPEDKTIAVTGTITKSEEKGLEERDENKITVKATVELPSADADTYTANEDEIIVKKWELQGDEADIANYVLPDLSKMKDADKKLAKGSFKIQEKEVHIVITNTVITNTDSKNTGTLNYGLMNNSSELVPENLTISVTGVYESEQAAFDENTTENLEIVPIEGVKDIGTHKAALIVDLSDANGKIAKNSREKKNYIFPDEGHTWADLVVEQETISDGDLSKVVEYSGTNIYTTDEYLVWINAETGKLYAAVKAGSDQKYDERYDTVILTDGNINLTKDGILSTELPEADSLTVYLALADGDSYKNASSEFALPFKLDADAPDVAFQSSLVETVPVADNLLKSISFGTFDKAVYEAKFTITDNDAGFAAKDNKAYVWELSESDLTDGVVSAARIEEKVGDIAAGDWTSFSDDEVTTAEGDYSVQVAVDKTGNADVIAGNYIVLVKTEDKVGNSKVYASNGIVIDVSKPTIEVTFEDETIKYYAGDINYHIKVTESAGVLGVSGVAEVTWEVLCDGKKVEDNSGSETLYKPEEKTQYSIQELQTVYEADKVISADLCNSNNIQLNVTAKDRAGNSVESETYDLIIDTTEPEITVAYDNNDARNDIYFKAGRTATVTFKERNFDKAKATFDITLEDGTVYQGITLEELGQITGIETAWGEDSQSGREEKDYTDDRTNTAMITFVGDRETHIGDNHYSDFELHCVDKTGKNENQNINYPSDVAKTEFVIDTTDPIIDSVTYTVGSSVIPVGKTEQDRIYKNQTINAKIIVDEHNFALKNAEGDLDRFADGQVNYSVTATKVGTEPIPDYNAQANTTGSWTSNGNVREATFVYSNDANYTTSFTYTDLAGNQAVWANEYFTVDKTPPTGSVKVGTRNVVTQFLNSITFYLYSKTPILVSFTGDDHTSPILPLVYYKAYTPMDLQTVEKITNWTPGTSFYVNPDSQVVPYLKVTDLAGNDAYFSSNEIAIADDTAPLNKDTSKPLITITTSQPPHDIYNGNVSFALHAEDPIVGNTYSGLATVKYEILNGNTVTQSHTYNYASNTNRTRTMDTNEVVTASLNNSNHVRIKVTATDNAGNVSEEIKDIKIDITKPKITVTFNNNNALNNKYYKDTRVATITVTERNFDPNNVQINVTNTQGTKASISGWSHSAGAGESDSATHTATITFSADGDYIFTVDCTDLAMNKAENPYKSEEFTIDKTIPTISVSYDNNSAQNGKYYKAARTATITINEHNFRASDVKVTTTASNGSAPGVSGWSSSGDRHTATVHFGSDADYTFDISYVDLAGNAAADYAQDSFTVDLTKPALEISGVADKSANKGTVAPVIKINDTNFISSGVTLTLTGSKKGKINVSGMISRSAGANGETITFRNFGTNMDDIYTLTAKSVDKAGNETSKSITFSVNRDGSTYDINDATKKLIEKGFTNDPQDIVIHEINVDTLEFIELSYSKDGEIKKLKEGTDYTVRQEGGNGQWKKYTYTIFASCFEGEGEYSINISSKDRAENVTNNKVQSLAIDFVVDKTAPVMAISNLENRGRYTENRHEYTLNVKDNAMLVSVEIYLDDVLFKTYHLVNGKLVNVDDESDVLEMDNGKVYLGIDSKNSYQKIKLVSTDAAGNVAETEEYNVLVTANRWVQFYMNKPLFFGSIAAILAVIAVIFFIIWKRRKDEEEKQQAKVRK